MEKSKLRKLKIKEADDLFIDSSLLSRVRNKKENVLIFEGVRKTKKIDPILDIELSVYKCERVGFFKK